VATVWTTLSLNIAASASVTVEIYFNGGYYTTHAVTTAWQTLTFPFSTFGNPANIGYPGYLIIQNTGTAGVTLYFNNVFLK